MGRATVVVIVIAVVIVTAAVLANTLNAPVTIVVVVVVAVVASSTITTTIIDLMSDFQKHIFEGDHRHTKGLDLLPLLRACIFQRLEKRGKIRRCVDGQFESVLPFVVGDESAVADVAGNQIRDVNAAAAAAAAAVVVVALVIAVVGGSATATFAQDGEGIANIEHALQEEGRAAAAQAAVREDCDSVSDNLSLVKEMRRHHNHQPFGPQLQQGLPHRPAADGVECRRGLVEKQDVAAADEGNCQGESALQPAFSQSLQHQQQQRERK